MTVTCQNQARCSEPRVDLHGLPDKCHMINIRLAVFGQILSACRAISSLGCLTVAQALPSSLYRARLVYDL